MQLSGSNCGRIHDTNMEVVLEVSVSVPGRCGASTSITKRCYIIYKPFYGLALMVSVCVIIIIIIQWLTHPMRSEQCCCDLVTLEFLLLQMTPQRCHMSKSLTVQSLSSQYWWCSLHFVCYYYVSPNRTPHSQLVLVMGQSRKSGQSCSHSWWQ